MVIYGAYTYQQNEFNKGSLKRLGHDNLSSGWVPKYRDHVKHLYYYRRLFLTLCVYYIAFYSSLLTIAFIRKRKVSLCQKERPYTTRSQPAVLAKVFDYACMMRACEMGVGVESEGER